MSPNVPSRVAGAEADAPDVSLTAAERELVRLSWAHAQRDAPRFAAALHAALAERLPALAALAGDAAQYAAGVGRLTHAVDVAVRHLDRLLASARGPDVPHASADPVGAALLDALAASHDAGSLSAPTRTAWLHTWAVMRDLLRPPAPPAAWGR